MLCEVLSNIIVSYRNLVLQVSERNGADFSYKNIS